MKREKTKKSQNETTQRRGKDEKWINKKQDRSKTKQKMYYNGTRQRQEKI